MAVLYSINICQKGEGRRHNNSKRALLIELNNRNETKSCFEGLGFDVCFKYAVCIVDKKIIVKREKMSI